MMKSWRISALMRRAVVVVCFGTFISATISAQTLVGPAPTEHTAEYVLGPDDQIVVRALDVEEIDGRVARVDLHGYIDVPLLGKVKAGGLSVEQLEAELARQLRKYVQEPQVTVTVSEYRSQPVSVLGAVNSPGVYNLTGRNTLVEVLSKAGGLRNDAGNTIEITRGRAWGAIPLSSAKSDPSGEFSTAQVSVKSLLEARDPQENIMIEPTDVISVPRADLVYIVGAVHRPGGFVLNERENMTVLQAVSMAEGLEKTSAPRRAKIIRKGMTTDRAEIPVNLVKILSGKSPDVPLLANDILFVPISGAKTAAYRSIEAAIQVGTGIAIFRP
jgi:polysaccharide biosynthesis/export protein